MTKKRATVIAGLERLIEDAASARIVWTTTPEWIRDAMRAMRAAVAELTEP